MSAEKILSITNQHNPHSSHHGGNIMNKFNIMSEQYGNAISDCISWMEDKVKEAAVELMEMNEMNRDTIFDSYEKGYYEGYHDALLDILTELGVDIDELDEEYYN
jgi:hypothetical protein